MAKDRPSTPPHQQTRTGAKHCDTPLRAAIVEANRLNDRGYLATSMAQVFKEHGISKSTGFRIIRDYKQYGTTRRLQHDPNRKDPRGRKKKAVKEAEGGVGAAETGAGAGAGIGIGVGAENRELADASGLGVPEHRVGDHHQQQHSHHQHQHQHQHQHHQDLTGVVDPELSGSTPATAAATQQLQQHHLATDNATTTTAPPNFAQDPYYNFNNPYHSAVSGPGRDHTS